MQDFYSLLTPNRQQGLYLYYATNQYDWLDEQAIDYRKRRSNSIAFNSGKAFNELYRIVISAAILLILIFFLFYGIN